MADIIDPAVQFVLHIPEIGENDFLSFLEGRPWWWRTTATAVRVLGLNEETIRIY